MAIAGSSHQLSIPHPMFFIMSNHGGCTNPLCFDTNNYNNNNNQQGNAQNQQNNQNNGNNGNENRNNRDDRNNNDCRPPNDNNNQSVQPHADEDTMTEAQITQLKGLDFLKKRVMNGNICAQFLRPRRDRNVQLFLL